MCTADVFIQNDSEYVPFVSGIPRLSLNLTGFDQQASNAVLDLVADEEELLKKRKSLTKW